MTKNDMLDLPPHPAVYSAEVITAFHSLIAQHHLTFARALDPMAGTGQAAADLPLRLVKSELQQGWAVQAGPGTVRADSRHLPFPDDTFDLILCSPAYGNRMADKHKAGELCKVCKGEGRVEYHLDEDRETMECPRCGGEGRNNYRRITYKHYLDRTGEQLHDANGGGMQWGEKYRDLHRAVWADCTRVVRQGGYFMLNVSDHIRGGERQQVVRWHNDTLIELGWKIVSAVPVYTKRMRMGANHDKRVEGEMVILYRHD